MPSSGKDRQAAFKKRMRLAGFVQVTGWIPGEDRERHRKYCEWLRKAKRRPGAI